MAVWIDRILLATLVIVVAILTLTSLGSLSGDPLGGNTLLAHMVTSGVLVVGLPVFAIAFLRHMAKPETSVTQGIGVLLTIAAGLISIVTVFLCMLPLPSTAQMHTLIVVHGWAGFAMIPAVALLLIGVVATRSASRPRS